MENPINKLEAAQTKLHNLESSQTNALAKIGGTKLNVILIMLTALITYSSVMFYDSFDKQIKNDRKIIWFDRKRIHSDAGFAKIDEKYPAQYEVWEGDKLIERWHWKVDNDDRTNQFGDYIFRCVANYDFSGKYTGFTQYQMRDYPKGDASVESERLTDTDSIKLELFNNSGKVILTGPNMSASFVMGKLKNTKKLSSGFAHSEDSLSPIDLVKNEQDFDYLVHLAKTFKFLNVAIIEPYESRTQFVKLIEDAPEESKQVWDNFVLKMETQPKETKAFIKEAWEEKNKDITSN
jgi:hypothetical protein